MSDIFASTITLELITNEPITQMQAQQLANDYCKKHNHEIEDFAVVSKDYGDKIITHINVFVR